MIRSIAIIGCLLTAIPASAQEVLLAVGGVEVVVPGGVIGTVAVGDPKVADVAVEGDGSVLVFGKAAGETGLVVFDRDRQLVHSSTIRVVPSTRSDLVTVRRAGERGLSSEDWMCGDGTCARVPPPGGGAR